jgi:hypothetical protein
MLSRLPHRLLTLDVARLTGWAFAPITAVVPACGVWTLPVADPLDHLGARIAMLEDLLGEFLEVEGVDMCASGCGEGRSLWRDMHWNGANGSGRRRSVSQSVNYFQGAHGEWRVSSEPQVSCATA